ncbi:MAG: SMI1/KNR4 family protein [Thermoguttaceae bacterium]
MDRIKNAVWRPTSRQTPRIRAVAHLKKRLERIGFTTTEGPEAVKRVEQLENLVGARLPSDYRSFLLEIGGGDVGDALAPCTIPTPFGEHIATTLHTVQEIIDLLHSGKAPRNMICIGYGHFGMTTCLSIAGLDHGQVFSLDTEMRFFWDDETLSRLPGLDPTIREFFRLRDADELPERPWGYENCYHVADSFSEFVGKLYHDE